MTNEYSHVIFEVGSSLLSATARKSMRSIPLHDASDDFLINSVTVFSIYLRKVVTHVREIT